MPLGRLAEGSQETILPMNIGFAAFLGLVGLTVIFRLREFIGILRDPERHKLIGERLFFLLGLLPWLLGGFIRGGTETQQVWQVLSLLALSLCCFAVAGGCWLVRSQQTDKPRKEDQEETWPSPENRMR